MSEGVTPVRVKRLRPNAKLPHRATEHATGFDVYACLDAPIEVGPGPVLIPLGIAMEIPPGFDAQVRPRSGLAKQGVLTTFGTIDADYRGELIVTMYAFAPGVSHVVHDGDRVAQLVIARLAAVAWEETDVLTETARGGGGHGSTGR